MFCFRSFNKQTKLKCFAFVPIISRPNQNLLLRSISFWIQIKLLCFVPEFLGQNGNDLLAIKNFLDQNNMFCFRSDIKRTKPKCFAFVPIISFDIGTFVLSFRYRWHYYPLSPTPPGEFVPSAFVAWGGQTRRAERGMGGQYFGRREK